MKRFIITMVCSFLLLLQYSVDAFVLHRVILATDTHENYIQFWPIVARAWKEIVGLQPTLALIADSSVEIDETLGDVIRFEPIEGIPTSLYAQCIRLLLPAFFEHEGCIISDIDMIPLSKSYFIDSVKDKPKNFFVVYRDKAYSSARFPMCYCAAYGNVWKEVFQINTFDDIPVIIKAWYELGLGWGTDEKVMYKYLASWDKYTTHCIRLGHGVSRRVDRSNWKYDINHIRSGYYIDAHCPRPYERYKASINEIIRNLIS